jgi:hypothetical protein
MKKIAIFLCALVAAGSAAYAQTDSKAALMADIERAGGVHYLYPTNQPAPTSAPKGYKAFYVSHVGRHGSRYALGGSVYEDNLAIWSKGHEKGWLTPEGEAFYQAYKDFYPSIALREGNLTHKGQGQHRYIASQIYKNYPSVFKGETHAEAVSTVSHRVIVSMFSFLSQLDNTDKDFTFGADYGQPYQSYLLPDVIDSGAERHGEPEVKYIHFRDEVLDLDGMLAKWFTQPDSLVTNKYKFCYDLHTVISTLDNTDVTEVPQALYSVYTPEERYKLWRVNNFRDYQLLGNSPDTEQLRMKAMKALLDDFVTKADEDMQSGQVQLRLRFGHDSTLMPLLSLLDVNGMGASISDPYEVEKYWQNYNIPMACNFQLIFFKSKKNPDILVQVLLNGFEAKLPLEMAAPGSFYRWEDIKAHYCN